MSEHSYNDSDVSVSERSHYLESQPLLSLSTQPVSRTLCPPMRQLCFMSKSIFVILLITAIVGAINFLIVGAVISALWGLTPLNLIDASLPFVITYSFMAIVLIFYPVNGFLADVYCGRHRIFFISLCLILCCFVIFLSVVLPIAYYTPLTKSQHVICFVIGFFGFLLAIVGIAGYGANFIQFGLDQLLEALSHHQALFVHWAKWCYDCLSVVIVGIFMFHFCKINSNWRFKWILSFFLVLVSMCVLLLSTVFAYWKRYWFYSESRHQNPYKMVAEVLTFVWKHKYALKRSAFTYCDDERPSRLDFAKERFGGPFSTEQVEDVKTLSRIVLILLAIGPVFSMDTLVDHILLLYIGLHIGSIPPSIQQCPVEYFVTNAGLLRYAVSALFLPLYVWIIFSLFGNRVPKMLTRIGIGMVVYFIGILSVFAVDSIGHHLKIKTDETYCIMHVHSVSSFPFLGMHWSVMIPSIIFLGIGPTILIATIFEFISAQSPHLMKGFLFGVFFAIRGVFQLFGSIVIFLFGSQRIWENIMIREHLPAVSCLSRCILFISVVVLISLILFLIAAKRYKHRERGDRPYDQRFVVDFYTRVIENRERNI